MKKINFFNILLVAFFLINCSKESSDQEVSVNNGKLTDYDGNNYRTVKIGNQVWTAENFRSTRYYDGKIIKTVKSPGNNAALIPVYGLLYSWADFKNPAIIPDGWRLPTLADYKQLFYTLGFKDSLNNQYLSPQDTSSVQWHKLCDPKGFNLNLAGGYENRFSFSSFNYSAWQWCMNDDIKYIYLSGYISFDKKEKLDSEFLASIRFIKK